MGRLIYSMGVSLDGFVEDAGGDFGWAEPDEEIHRLANEDVREAAALLYGRRLYEIMEGFWPDAATRNDLPEVAAEFARAYVATPRIVFSDTLDVASGGARLVGSADALDEVRRLKEESDGPLAIGGAGLAASLIDLIDEFRMWVAPVVVGGGKPFFPQGRDQLRLRLLEARRFASGQVYLRYERASD